MKKLALIALLLNLAAPVFSQQGLHGATPGNPKTPKEREAAREAAEVLRSVSEEIMLIAQSARGQDTDQQRRVAQKLRQIDEKMKKYSDPAGLQAALQGLMMTMQGLSMQTSRLQGAELEQLTRDMKEIDSTLAEEIDPETLAKARKARKEGAAKGNLGSIRSALSIYYGDKEGAYPKSLDELPSKYLAAIPVLDLPDHKPNSEWRAVKGVSTMDDLKTKLKDTGQWLYVGDSSAKMNGTIVIDCTHVDSRGRPWHGF